MRKVILAILILSLVLVGVACSKNDKPVIGIVQIAEHVALDQSYEGFCKALEDNQMLDKVELDFHNAQGDMNNLSTIADRFVSKKVDMILAIATDSAQAVAGKTKDI
ncbi:MAG: ABC transporter substrate binding protein, partial [Eubacteriales bacterium]|nr:ABC transporter substrate binding protein [Eubacteriales bacterium]